jgi:cytochrome P450
LAEVEKVIGKDKPLDYIPNYEEVKQFEYMMTVIKESLRLYPSAPTLPVRETTEEVVLGEYHFPKKSYFTINVLALHLNEKYFEKPDEFIPERFSKENSSKIYPNSYIPFGGGSRVCKSLSFSCKESMTTTNDVSGIGQSFSLVEQRVVLAMFLRNYRFELPRGSKHSDTLKCKVGGLLAPDDLQLEIHPRRT